MEFLRDWILRIFGIIILISACDIIMIEGEMKKYIKPILGLVLVLVVVQPLSKDLLKQINIEPENIQAYASGISKNIGQRQLKDISELFEKRLEEELETRIDQEYGLRANIAIKVKTENSQILGVESLKAELYTDQNLLIDENEIKQFIEENFGILCEEITIKLKEEGG